MKNEEFKKINNIKIHHVIFYFSFIIIGIIILPFVNKDYLMMYISLFSSLIFLMYLYFTYAFDSRLTYRYFLHMEEKRGNKKFTHDNTPKYRIVKNPTLETKKEKYKFKKITHFRKNITNFGILKFKKITSF